MRIVPIAWILAPLAFQLAALAFSPADVPQAGQQASEFTLPSQDGTQLGLKDFRGKWVVLYFYPKDNTPGCTIEAHNFQRDLAKYEQDNAVIVGQRGFNRQPQGFLCETRSHIQAAGRHG